MKQSSGGKPDAADEAEQSGIMTAYHDKRE